MIREKGMFLDPDVRLLLLALTSLEERLDHLEAEVRRSHVLGEEWRP